LPAIFFFIEAMREL